MAIPTNAFPDRGWPDRSLPFSLALSSSAEQIGQIPERGVPIGTPILRGVLIYGSGALVSDAEQIGQIPERGVPIGAAPLRGMLVYGAEEAGGYAVAGYATKKEEQRPYRSFRDDKEIMEIMSIILASEILN